MWSKRYDKCRECGTVEIRHHARGLCVNCYCRLYHQENKDRLNALQRKRRQSPKYKSKDKAYRESPKGRASSRERTKRYRERHPERTKEAMRRWRDKNPNYNEEYRKRLGVIEKERRYHRIRKYGEDALEVLERDNDTCQKCGSTEQIHIHHIDWDEDNNDLDNLVLLCNSCHQKLHLHVPLSLRRATYDDFMQNVING